MLRTAWQLVKVRRLHCRTLEPLSSLVTDGSLSCFPSLFDIFQTVSDSNLFISPISHENKTANKTLSPSSATAVRQFPLQTSDWGSPRGSIAHSHAPLSPTLPSSRMTNHLSPVAQRSQRISTLSSQSYVYVASVVLIM